jgi:hypothetical protein
MESCIHTHHMHVRGNKKRIITYSYFSGDQNVDEHVCEKFFTNNSFFPYSRYLTNKLIHI